MNTVAIFVVFFALLLIAVPIASTLGLVSLLPGVVDPGFSASVSYILRSMLNGLDSFRTSRHGRSGIPGYDDKCGGKRPV